MISWHWLTGEDVFSSGCIVKSLTLGHKMVCQTLVTAITLAHLMGDPPPPTWPAGPLHGVSQRLSLNRPIAATSFMSPILLMSAIVCGAKAAQPQWSEEWLFKWTCRSKAVVAGPRTWLDWLIHSGSCCRTQSGFPDTGTRGGFTDDFQWNELQCGFEVRHVYVASSFPLIYVIHISEDLRCSINICVYYVYTVCTIWWYKKKTAFC